MDWPITIAITALVMSVLARPLELAWDKLFAVTKQNKSAIFNVLSFTVQFVVPIALLVYTLVWTKFGKLFVCVYSWAVAIFMFNLLSWHIQRMSRLHFKLFKKLGAFDE